MRFNIGGLFQLPESIPFLKSKKNIDQDELQHAKVGSWFLGPRAENLDVFKELMAFIVEDHGDLRRTLYPDPNLITPAMKQTEEFRDGISTLKTELASLVAGLRDHSIPFWSPRYNGHMNMDTTMASILGYTAAMMYNPNNLAVESSPFTTMIEAQVGRQLCDLLGFKAGSDKQVAPWGHITCDGSIANLEAIWAARSLTFYPLSMKWAMEPGNPLEFLAPIFTISNCNGETKLFSALTPTELLNLTPSQILDIPTRLNRLYGISAPSLESALRPFVCQSVGQGALEEKFQTGKPKFFVSATKHYSWPKGGAITGMGSDRFVDVGVDLRGRMDIDDLKTRIDQSLSNGKDKTVFGVIVVMGSTEHGACDPLKEVIALRTEYEKKGISFAIHCDAAWGGYFASTLRQSEDATGQIFVPPLALSKYTEDNLRCLAQADSVTIDPHKSGYVNYPAGGLCYRDRRMRYLVTWTSPVLVLRTDDLESTGIYGVEGSKPGAAPVAAWLSHKTIGLNDQGYGRLLGESIFTSSKLYCHWATLTIDEPELLLVPFQMLPSEQSHDWNSAEVTQERNYVRNDILGRTNKQLMDEDTERFLKAVGGDLMINVFACNFKINGVVNTDVNEANYLNTEIFKRLSVTTLGDTKTNKPMFLTKSKFIANNYGDCLRNYKKRLGLGPDAKGDLVSLVNVTMSPWLSDFKVMQTVVEEFKRIALEELQKCKIRNEPKEDSHGFIMQGDQTLFLVHLPMFNMQNHRRQLIVEAEIPKEVMQYYQELRASPENASKFYTVGNTTKAHLSEITQVGSSFEARLDDGLPSGDTEPLRKQFSVKIVRIVVSEPLSFNALDAAYPQKMPFYLYGQNDEYHIDHMLRKSPNAQLNADSVKVAVNPSLSSKQLKSGVVVTLETIFEQALQPLPIDDTTGQIVPDSPGLNFSTGFQHEVKVFSRDNWQAGVPIATGTIELGSRLFADWSDINMDPAAAGHGEMLAPIKPLF